MDIVLTNALHILINGAINCKKMMNSKREVTNNSSDKKLKKRFFSKRIINLSQPSLGKDEYQLCTKETDIADKI